MKDNHIIESFGQNLALSKLSRRTFVKGMGLAAVSALLPLPHFGSAHAKPLKGSDFVDRWKDGCGLVHNRVSAKWAKVCESLPCFNGVTWPGYAEKVIPNVKISGRDGVVYDAVVHLWKGVCQKFLEPTGVRDFPGGCGAEVGVYLRRDAEWLAKHPLPALTGLAPLNYSYDTNDRWYPAPELGTQLEFRLVDPENKDALLLQTDKIKSYWCTEWLERDSYEKWERARPQFLVKKKTIHPVRLTLQYWINGKRQPDWVYEKGDESCTPNIGCHK